MPAPVITSQLHVLGKSSVRSLIVGTTQLSNNAGQMVSHSVQSAGKRSVVCRLCAVETQRTSASGHSCIVYGHSVVLRLRLQCFSFMLQWSTVLTVCQLICVGQLSVYQKYATCLTLSTAATVRPSAMQQVCLHLHCKYQLPPAQQVMGVQPHLHSQHKCTASDTTAPAGLCQTDTLSASVSLSALPAQPRVYCQFVSALLCLCMQCRCRGRSWYLSAFKVSS